MLSSIKQRAKGIKLRFPLYLIRTFEKFLLDACSYQAATLTFYTLFALVPFLGLMFGLAQSFGFESTLNAVMKELLVGQEQVYENLLVFTQNLLAQTKEAIIAGVGFIVLMWSVFKVIRVLDHIFNKIWAVQFQKNPLFRVHQFAALMLLLPLLLIILSGAMIYSLDLVSSVLPNQLNLGSIDALPSQTKLISIFLFTLLMGFSYWGIPVVQVPLVSALTAGFFASLLFHLLQYGYISFQQEINEFGVVYGSFASVPLFMLWIYMSWTIYLLGAQLTYVIESRITRSWEFKIEKMPHHLQQALLLEIMHVVIDKFSKGEPALSAKDISEHLSVSLAVIRYMVDKLLLTKLLIQAQSSSSARLTSYIPSKSVVLLTDTYIIYELNHSPSQTYGAAIERLAKKQK